MNVLGAVVVSREAVHRERRGGPEVRDCKLPQHRKVLHRCGSAGFLAGIVLGEVDVEEDDRNLKDHQQ